MTIVCTGLAQKHTSSFCHSRCRIDNIEIFRRKASYQLLKERIMGTSQNHTVCSGLQHRVNILFYKSFCLRRIGIPRLYQFHKSFPYTLNDLHLFFARVFFRSCKIKAAFESAASELLSGIPDEESDREKAAQIYRRLTEDAEYKEFVQSKQIYRSGTSIGANVRESKHAQSDADFLSKMSIAYKEADETDYWLNLLYDNGYLNDDQFESLSHDIQRIIKILTSIVKTLNQKVKGK